MGEDAFFADRARLVCQTAFRSGYGTWRDVFYEEVMEALAENDPEKLRTELVQVAAVIFAWLENIERGGQPECGKECDEMHTESNFNCVIWRNRHGLV